VATDGSVEPNHDDLIAEMANFISGAGYGQRKPLL
jgi:hypothetical protein